MELGVASTTAAQLKSSHDAKKITLQRRRDHVCAFLHTRRARVHGLSASECRVADHLDAHRAGDPAQLFADGSRAHKWMNILHRQIREAITSNFLRPCSDSQRCGAITRRSALRVDLLQTRDVSPRVFFDSLRTNLTVASSICWAEYVTTPQLNF